MSGIVIVGNGPCAHQLVTRLREHGYSGGVVVLGAEDAPAYNRVLLPSVLAGSLRAQDAVLPDVGAQVHRGVRVAAVDTVGKTVSTTDGRCFDYDALVLATGSVSREGAPGAAEGPGAVATAGAEATAEPPVWSPRTLGDCARLDGGNGPVAVLGGGVLGVEVACALRTRGRAVTLVHRRAWPMNRQLDGSSGGMLAAQLRELGVDLRLERTAVARRAGGVELDDGAHVAAAHVLTCVGARPAVELAARAGLAVRDGVVVNAAGSTSDPHVFAIGDCAEHPQLPAGQLSSGWDQAEAVARALTGGEPHRPTAARVMRPRTRDVDVAVLGDPDAAPQVSTVTLSDPARWRYARLALRGDRLLGAVLFGLPAAIAALTQLYERGAPVPRSRLSLLLGLPERTGTGGGELPDDAVVCHCNNVTKESVLAARDDGARTVPEFARATRATTGCGGCLPVIERLCRTADDRTDRIQEDAT
ncbi:FAD-dependent oxidoreductase [Salinifilum ghardaiensis]